MINSFLDDIEPIAEKYSASISQLVVNWTTKQPGITCVLVGARNSEQVLHNIGSLNFSLSNEELRLIGEKLSKLMLKPL